MLKTHMAVATSLLFCSISPSGLVAAANAKTVARAYVANASSSTISFSTMQNGSPVRGSFPITAGHIFFDPVTPGNSTAEFRVSVKEMQVIPEGLLEATTSNDWLDSAEHPSAGFISTDFRKAKNGQYFLEGNITVKGITRSIAATVEIIHHDAKKMRARARFALNRTMFKVGWDDTSSIPADTNITVDIQARAE